MVLRFRPWVGEGRQARALHGTFYVDRGGGLVPWFRSGRGTKGARGVLAYVTL